MSDPAARASIPKWHEFVDPVMRVLAETHPMKLQDIYAAVAERVALSDAARAELIPSGQPVYWNRIGWAITRSKGAGLIHQPARATYELSDEGMRRAADPAPMSEATLLEYPQYREWIDDIRRNRGKPKAIANESQTGVDEDLDSSTPIDRIDEAVAELDKALEDRVYTALLQIDNPYDFERIVTDFVARLGYGVGFEVTSRSGDLGIDGIVMRDILGLERVYVQAKRYGEGNPVSAEAVRAFIGSLGLHRASIGVMITTSSFARTSHDEVERTHSTNVRLIDGRELARLMVKHRIGVSVERTIEIKRIDTDRFFGAADVG